MRCILAHAVCAYDARKFFNFGFVFLELRDRAIVGSQRSGSQSPFRVVIARAAWLDDFYTVPRSFVSVNMRGMARSLFSCCSSSQNPAFRTHRRMRTLDDGERMASFVADMPRIHTHRYRAACSPLILCAELLGFNFGRCVWLWSSWNIPPTSLVPNAH